MPRKPVLLVHGLLQSSFRWVLNGPKEDKSKAIAYRLADSGFFDVWILNLRGNVFSRDHAFLDADSSPKFWDFSFEEFGEIDVPAVIDHITKETGVEQLEGLIAYSQGTTSILYGMSEQSKAEATYRQKVRQAFLLAPAVYFSGLKVDSLKFVIKNPFLFKFLYQFGYYQIKSAEPWARDTCSRSHDDLQSKFQLFCQEYPKYCEQVLDLDDFATGFLLSLDRQQVFQAHSQQGTSIKNLQHMAQLAGADKFQRFDYGQQIN